MNDLRSIVRFAEERGWTVARTKRHLLFRNAEGRAVATAAITASDGRSLNNTISNLRKGGLPVPHKGGRGSRERK